MATIYVAKTGNDTTGDGSAGNPYLTIGKGCLVLSSGDIVEITDEGTYYEAGIAVNASDITIRHTASHLGRPKIKNNPSGAGSAFTLGTYTDFKLYGLELSDYWDNSAVANYVINVSTAGTPGIHISGCFIHDCSRLLSSNAQGTSGNPVKIEQSAMQFKPNGIYSITNDGYMEITNCFISSSAPDSTQLLKDWSGNGTASFCTIVRRNTYGGLSSAPIVQFGKVNNCLVYSAQAGGSDSGIASDDRNNNIAVVDLIETAGHDRTGYRTFADASASAGVTEVAINRSQVSQVDFVSSNPAFDIGDTISIVKNFNIEEDSIAIGAGVSYDSINVDITGTARPQDDTFDIGCFEHVGVPPEWSGDTIEQDPNFTDGFIIQNYNNLASNHKFRTAADPGQAPFSLGTKGPSSLRGRTKAYKTTK